MEERSEILINEISQVLGQYREEVPGKRRAMPESIKTRVSELHRMGFSAAEVARRTGIPYFTVLTWKRRQKTAGFDVVKVVKNRSAMVPKIATVTVPRRRRSKVDTVTESTFSTVTITLPNGVRIEGVGVDLLLRLIPTMGGVR